MSVVAIFERGRLLNRALVFILLLVLTAQAGGVETDASVSDKDKGNLSGIKVVTFGCLLPLTGKYRQLGETALKGILAGADSGPGGFEFRIIVKDMGDSEKSLTAALNELLNTPGMSFIIGPVPSKFIRVASSRVNAKRIPSVTFPVSESGTAGGPYIIKYYYPLEEQVGVLSRYAARELGIRTFAILYPQTALGKKMKDIFAASVAENGGKLVYAGFYNPESRDISKELGWISSISPEAVFIPDGAASSAELILRLKREGKLRDVLFLGPSTWNSPLFLDLIGDEIDGFVFRAVFTDVYYYGDGDWEEFAKLVESKFQEKPDLFGYQVYRVLGLMLSVVRENGRSQKEIMDGLNSLKSDPAYYIKTDKSGSIQVSPRYRILSVSDGELVDIIKVK
jgi:branched-chain amino acid transport system substrate-binding protein